VLLPLSGRAGCLKTPCVASIAIGSRWTHDEAGRAPKRCVIQGTPLASRLDHGATGRAGPGASSGGDGWLARATEECAEELGDRRRVRHHGAHGHTAAAAAAALHVNLECSAQQERPIHA
jgi:hypothetical protein